MWLHGLLIAVSPADLAALIAGSVLGLVIGVTPGHGPVFALSLFIPLTLGLPADIALAFLASIYVSSVYGGGIIAILINTPGTPGNIATTFDGYPMARRGQAGIAITAAGVSGALCGLVSVLVVAVVSPYIAAVALKISPADYFMLAIFGISMVAAASTGDPLHGLILGAIGFLLSLVGQDPITGGYRFTLQNGYLMDGINFPVMTVGIFAVGRALIMIEEAHRPSLPASVRSSGGRLEGALAVIRRPFVVLRSALTGLILGAIPGIGISTSNIVAYLIEKRVHGNAGFGEGNVVGVIASEGADNATLPAELIPAFTLGIPGASASALMLTAVTIHGMQPGVGFFKTGSLPYAFFVSLALAQVAFAFIGILISPFLAKVARVPNRILGPFLLVLGLIGAFAVRGRFADMGVALVFGIVGYVIVRLGWPVAPLILGRILGPLVETNYRRAILIAHATGVSPFMRPLPLILALASVLVFCVPLIEGWRGGARRAQRGTT